MHARAIDNGGTSERVGQRDGTDEMVGTIGMVTYSHLNVYYKVIRQIPRITVINQIIQFVFFTGTKQTDKNLLLINCVANLLRFL